MPFRGFICESNREKISPDACLTCSLQGGLPGCHLTPPVVRGITANSAPRDLRGGPSATELLGCPRKLVLRRRVDYWEKPSEAYWRFRGQMGHALVEDYHDPADGVIAEVRFEAQIDGLTISGKPDALYYVDRAHLADYKTTKALPKTWKVYTCPKCDQVLREGQWAARRGTTLKCCGESYKPKSIVAELPPRAYGSHVAQLNIYRWLLVQNGREVRSMEVVYLDMTGMLRVPVSLWPLSRVEDLIRERLRPLRPYYDNGIEAPKTLPTGVQDDEDRRWECRYCAVVEQCRVALEQATVIG
jgi:CRISPR/Cas system-associated exonuclease Cas4 (RecB family)